MTHHIDFYMLKSEVDKATSCEVWQAIEEATFPRLIKKGQMQGPRNPEE
jgi:hypothetical protein